jgi:hypothetical protein
VVDAVDVDERASSTRSLFRVEAAGEDLGSIGSGTARASRCSRGPWAFFRSASSSVNITVSVRRLP